MTQPQSPEIVEWLKDWADRYRLWLFAALGLLQIATFNGQWLLGPDTSNFASTARHLVETGVYDHPQGYDAVGNPGLPLLLALNFTLFGVSTFWPILLLYLGMGLAILALTYRLICHYADRPTAVIVTVMLGVSYTFCCHVPELLSDLPFMLGLMLLLVGLEHWRSQPSSRSMAAVMIVSGWGVMMSFRLVAVIVAVAFGTTLAVRAVRSRHRHYYIAAAVTLIAVFIALRLVDPRNPDGLELLPKERHIIARLFYQPQKTSHEALLVNLPRLLTQTTPDALFGNELGLEVISAAASVAVIGAGILLVRRRLLWGLLVALFVMQWIVFLPSSRYFLPILPLMALACWNFAVACSQRLPQRSGSILFAVMLIIWIGMNLGRTVGFIVDQRSAPYLRYHSDGRYERVPEMGRALTRHVGPDAVVVSPQKLAGPLRYYSQRTVVSASVFAAGFGDATSVYVLHPGEDISALVKERGWTVGPALAVESRPEQPPLALHRVLLDQSE